MSRSSPQRKTAQPRFESKDAPARYHQHSKMEQDTDDQLRDLNTLFQAAKITESTRQRLADCIPVYAAQRDARIKPFRDALQQRLSEEASLISLAKSEPGPHGHHIPRPLCEDIARRNNRAAKWDAPLEPATFYTQRELRRQARQSRPSKEN